MIIFMQLSLVRNTFQISFRLFSKCYYYCVWTSGPVRVAESLDLNVISGSKEEAIGRTGLYIFEDMLGSLLMIDGRCLHKLAE